MFAWPEARRRGLSREEVAEDQRRRVYAALASAVVEHGYEQLTIKQVIESAGISRRTFYELFGSKVEAFLAAHDEALDRLERAVGEACRAQSDWPGRVRSILGSVLELAAEDPAGVRLAAGEPFTTGPHVLHCQEALLARFGPGLREGWGLGPTEFPAATTLVIGGIVAVIVGRLRSATGRPDLGDIHAPLTCLVLDSGFDQQQSSRSGAELNSTGA